MRIAKQKYLKAILIILAFALIALASPRLTHAAKSGMEISPVTYDFEIKPGETQSGSLNVRNLDSTPLNYVIETELFSKVSEDGAPSFDGTEKPEGTTTLVDWITFKTPKEGTLSPNSQADVLFDISIPLGAEPGGHYAAIFAKQIKKDSQGKTQLGVQSRVGLLILVSVPGDVKKTAEIKSFEYPSFITKGPSVFDMKVENTGSVHYESTVKVELKPWLGKVQTAELGKHTILPQNIRDYNGKWMNKYPFGYYKVTATATDGNGQLVTTTGSLWALPINIVIPLILLVILLWWLIIYIRSHFKLVKSNSENSSKE